MILYVAGPMAGLPGLNFDAFYNAAKFLTDFDHTALNPATLDRLHPGQTYDFYLRAAVKMLLEAEGVAVLPGWQESRGARLEVHIAETINMPVNPVEWWASGSGARMTA